MSSGSTGKSPTWVDCNFSGGLGAVATFSFPLRGLFGAFCLVFGEGPVGKSAPVNIGIVGQYAVCDWVINFCAALLEEFLNLSEPLGSQRLESTSYCFSASMTCLDDCVLFRVLPILLPLPFSYFYGHGRRGDGARGGTAIEICELKLRFLVRRRWWFMPDKPRRPPPAPLYSRDNVRDMRSALRAHRRHLPYVKTRPRAT